MLAYDITREIDCQWEIAGQARNDTRTVVKEPPIPLDKMKNAEIYAQRQGPNHAEGAWLMNQPRGGQGRKTPHYAEKQKSHLRRAMKRLMGIVRTNFGYDLDREAHLTLTYQGIMTCTETLQKNLQEFIRLMKKHHPDHEFDYIAVMEPHGHGGWHIHMLLKSNLPLWHDNGVVGLSYEKTRELWRKAIKRGGAVHHSRLPDDCHDFGKYFAAYFTTAIPEEVELSGDREAIKTASKAATKGSRLTYYPIGFKFYRCSRGIVRPKTEKERFASVMGDYSEAESKVAFGIYKNQDCLYEPVVMTQLVQPMSFYKKP